MNNPYQAPQAPSAVDSRAISTLGHFVFGIGLVCSIVAAIMPFVVVPVFIEMFKSFGTDLPWATRLAIRWYGVGWLLPLVVILVRLYWPDVRWRGIAAGLAGFGGVTVFALLLVLAMYLPIFQLGAVV
jgi:type II secretory pathway component PulF